MTFRLEGVSKINSGEVIKRLDQMIPALDVLAHQRLNIQNNDLVGINILILTQRILNGYKATKLLTKHGFFLEASALVRSIIEAVFVFNGIIDKPEETLQKMEQLANYNKQKLHRNALKHDMLAGNANKFDFSDLDAEKIPLVQLANLSSKNKQLYEVAYGMLCDEVHLNQASLEKLLDVKDNVIVAIKPNHDAEDFDVIYLTLFYCIHSVLTDLNQIYTLGMSSQLSKMQALLEGVLPK